MSDTKPYVYAGNPGYLYPFAPAPLEPGDTVHLTAEQAASVGDDFTPAPTPKATKAETTKDKP